MGAASELICCDRPSNAVSWTNATSVIFFPATVTLTCTIPYWVFTASPTNDAVAALVAGVGPVGVLDGFGGAPVDVPPPDAAGLVAAPPGSAADGSPEAAPRECAWDLKLNKATMPSTVPVIENRTRFIGVVDLLRR